MASFAAKVISKRILGESLENKFGKEDPYFESVPATRLDGKPGKPKRRKKALPPGISDHDAKVLTKVKRRAYRLDMSLFSFLGVRFGWGSVIGLIPAIGDVVDAFMALMVMKTCMSVEGGLPSGLKIKMVFNIFFDFIIGLVPFVGDLVDAIFRANTRNVVLLEEYLRQNGKKNLRQSGLPIPAIDPSDPVEFDRAQNESSPGSSSRQHSRQPSRQPSPNPPPYQQGASHNMPREPDTAQARDNGGGWLGRERPHDVEMGREDNIRSDSRRKQQRSGRR